MDLERIDCVLKDGYALPIPTDETRIFFVVSSLLNFFKAVN